MRPMRRRYDPPPRVIIGGYLLGRMTRAGGGRPPHLPHLEPGRRASYYYACVQNGCVVGSVILFASASAKAAMHGGDWMMTAASAAKVEVPPPPGTSPLVVIIREGRAPLGLTRPAPPLRPPRRGAQATNSSVEQERSTFASALAAPPRPPLEKDIQALYSSLLTQREPTRQNMKPMMGYDPEEGFQKRRLGFAIAASAMSHHRARTWLVTAENPRTLRATHPRNGASAPPRHRYCGNDFNQSASFIMNMLLRSYRRSCQRLLCGVSSRRKKENGVWFGKRTFAPCSLCSSEFSLGSCCPKLAVCDSKKDPASWWLLWRCCGRSGGVAVVGLRLRRRGQGGPAVAR